MQKRKAATPPKPDVQMIPLNRLKKSPRNARKVPHTKEEIEELAASIKAHGLLQNPVVEPECDRANKPTGHFLVTAGEGRRLALLLRAKRREIPKTFAVRCSVDTDHDPYEISLAENTVRSPMHPADQFDAFHALHTGKGMAAEDIAGRFGVAPTVVRQRLKLAAVSPALMMAYRAGAMALDQLSAFAISDDHAFQERIWEELGSRARREDILAALTHAQVPASDPRAIFVGADAYREAGGAIRQDLFDDEGGGYFADAELLLRLAGEKLEAIAASLRGEGWKWVEAMPRFDHDAVAECRRVYPLPKELSEAEAERLAALETEYEELEFDGSEESAAAIARLEEEIAAIQGDPVFDAATIARAGAIVSIAHDGAPRIERGFIRPEDDVRKEKAASAKKPNGAGGLSEKLLGELTAFKTVALQHALGESPDTALTAVTHALALAACFRGAAEMSCLQIAGRAPNLAAFLPSIEDADPARKIAARHEGWAKGLPDDPALLWDHLAEQSPEQRLALLAHCAAFTIDAVHRPVADDERVAHAGRLAAALQLDLAASWRPTAKNYLGRVSKERILMAVREALSEQAAQNLATLPKAAMAEAAEARLADTSWLPEPLRVAPITAEAAAPRRPNSRRQRNRAAAPAR